MNNNDLHVTDFYLMRAWRVLNPHTPINLYAANWNLQQALFYCFYYGLGGMFNKKYAEISGKR